jgi:hypothetical protein
VLWVLVVGWALCLPYALLGRVPVRANFAVLWPLWSKGKFSHGP